MRLPPIALPRAAPNALRPALCGHRCRCRHAEISLLASGAPVLTEGDGLVLLISPFVVASVAIVLVVFIRDLAEKPELRARVANIFSISFVDSSDVMAAIEPVSGRQRREDRRIFEVKTQQALNTLVRIGIPSVVATLLAFIYFDNLCLALSSSLDKEALKVFAQDNNSGQFIQNFLVVIDLLFAILAGNAYADLYEQQEAIYCALYSEVTVAKSLLEQLTLVGQGRPWYRSALTCMQQYVSTDLRRLDVEPVEVLSQRPSADPLESIMYMTSVGVPSVVYETVRDLRQARGVRLGSFQRKFPALGITLLYALAAVELFAFPLLGAGTADISELPEFETVSILELQSLLFAAVTGCLVLVLRIIQELWQSSGGVFNVDDVLQQMVFGLEEELELRVAGQLLPRTAWGVPAALLDDAAAAAADGAVGGGGAPGPPSAGDSAEPDSGTPEAE